MPEALGFWIFFWCGGWEIACLIFGILVLVAVDCLEAAPRPLPSEERR